ncbi:hypothetical protein U0070_026009 [Myodes glareolus]|uniref:PPIase cyclophilin-type domain-containing protein n=1 Tax=Myodes glareolus TaxID=447135 RepID=A0AAW0J345_MYOGA
MDCNQLKCPRKRLPLWFFNEDAKRIELSLKAPLRESAAMKPTMVNPTVFFDITTDPLGRVSFKLFADKVPKTAENFGHKISPAQLPCELGLHCKRIPERGSACASIACLRKGGHSVSEVPAQEGNLTRYRKFQ